jgi:hypothetical protein
MVLASIWFRFRCGGRITVAYADMLPEQAYFKTQSKIWLSSSLSQGYEVQPREAWSASATHARVAAACLCYLRSYLHINLFIVSRSPAVQNRREFSGSHKCMYRYSAVCWKTTCQW